MRAAARPARTAAHGSMTRKPRRTSCSPRPIPRDDRSLETSSVKQACRTAERSVARAGENTGEVPTLVGGFFDVCRQRADARACAHIDKPVQSPKRDARDLRGCQRLSATDD